MERGKWRVVGVGFNGFCQLNFPGTDKNVEVRANTASTELAAEQELRVMSPRVLMELASPPSRVSISSAWDALHMFVEGAEGAQSVTTGRWLHTLEEVKRRLREGETVTEVVETQGGRLLLSTTRSRRLLALRGADGAVQVEEWSPPQPVLEMSALEDGQIFALLSSGRLYHCSIDPPDSCNLLGPEVPLGQHSISHMCCGTDHTLLLTQDGSLLSFGLGSRGQLGHGDILPRPEPCLVSALAGLPVKAVACGSWHCLALSECGDVYSWGWNKDGQLGLRETAGLTVATPTLVDIGAGGGGDVSFVSVSCGSRHSAALTEAGVLYSWGWNDYGQLGSSAVCGSRWRAVYCSYWNTLLVQ